MLYGVRHTVNNNALLLSQSLYLFLQEALLTPRSKKALETIQIPLQITSPVPARKTPAGGAGNVVSGVVAGAPSRETWVSALPLARDVTLDV